MPTELTTWLHAFLGNDVDWKQVLLIGMTPVFLIAFAIEYAVMTGRGRREPFRWKEIAANLSLGAGYQVAETVMGPCSRARSSRGSIGTGCSTCR